MSAPVLVTKDLRAGYDGVPVVQGLDLAVDAGDEQGATLKEGMRSLGHHPDTGEEVTVRRGPYGLYVQQGENSDDKKAKPKQIGRAHV